jgi:hypothetical protein
MMKMERKPVVLSENTVLCINVYNTDGMMLSEIFIQDFLDEQNDDDKVARTLVDAIASELSVSMIWALRDALARQIEKRNSEFGVAHPKDRPLPHPPHEGEK